MRIAIVLLPLFLISTAADGQHAICGDPPPVADEMLKGDIEGEVQFLTRFFADASLEGHIETSRTEIFSKYPNANERSNAYFDYLLCILVMEDEAMSTLDKIDLIERIRQTNSRSMGPVQRRD